MSLRFFAFDDNLSCTIFGLYIFWSYFYYEDSFLGFFFLCVFPNILPIPEELSLSFSKKGPTTFVFSSQSLCVYSVFGVFFRLCFSCLSSCLTLASSFFFEWNIWQGWGNLINCFNVALEDTGSGLSPNTEFKCYDCICCI